MRINSVIPICEEKNDDLMNKNSFDECIFNSPYNDYLEKEKLIEESKTVLSLSKENINELMINGVKIQEEEQSSEGLILKELPKHLKYVFLGEEKSKPVIIEANMTTEKE